MKNSERIVLIMAGLLLAIPLARASPVAIGDPFLGHSWGNRFAENGWYNGQQVQFDTLVIRLVSGGPFEPPAMRHFGDLGCTRDAESWEVTLSNPDLTIATGDPSNGLLFDFVFEGLPDNPLAFDYLVYGDGELEGSTEILWSGGSNGTFSTLEIVPAPAAALLAAIGLSLVGWVKRHIA